MMQRKAGFFIVPLMVLVVFFSGCAGEQGTELPAIKVVFSHYNVNGTHLLEINEVDDVFINRSEAPKLYTEPPFPGIHAFAYNGLDRTPITHIPLDREGDNLTTYIGFEEREKVPQKGDRVLVYMDVVDRKGKILTSNSKRITWELEPEGLDLSEIG
ncbi:MAG: hypothetical protein ACLFVX_07665 [Archaeoglobaceae archaeon]